MIVGLSGGADSVALLKILVHLGYSCIAAHCNFHLRGEESDRDEAFSRQLAESLNIPFYKIDFDTCGYAADHHISIEMAARELRYNWFEELRCELHAQAIAVAHHRDDNIETLLMNLIRGTGIRGLGGIRPKNGYVVRPLLCLTREDILAWLEKEKQPYMTDHTNASDAYRRNFIRLNLLPLMEEINPSVRDALARTAANLSSVEILYNQVVEEARQKVFVRPQSISIPLLMEYSAPDTILYELLQPYHFNRIQVREIFQALYATSGKEFYSSTHRLVKDRDMLLLSDLEGVGEVDESFLITSETDIKALPIELSMHSIVYTVDTPIDKDKNTAWLDAAKFRFPLVVRRWRKGDWFVPFGMKGKQKLSDYFSNNKYSLMDKENCWLLCSGDDILWVIGERTDNRFRVDATTKQVFVVKKNAK